MDFLKKGVDIGRISSYNNKALRRYAVNAMRNCVMVAPATLTRIVRVRILLPQPNGSICCRFLRGIAQLVARCVRDAEALSSNLNTPTIRKTAPDSQKRLSGAVFSHPMRCSFSVFPAVYTLLRLPCRPDTDDPSSISLTKDRRGAAPRRSFIFSEFLWFHWANGPQSMNHLLLCAVSSTGCFTASPFLPSKSRPQPVATATTITANSVKP